MTYVFSESVRAFLQEKKYLQNVSTQTTTLYETSFKAFYGCETTDDIKKRVVELRQKGIKPVSVNTYLRHMKTYYLWQGKEWTLPWLKEEDKLLPTFSTNDISALVRFKAAGTNAVRVRMGALLILDSGIRISECLGLAKEHINLEQCSLTVVGKGGKHRVVPFSQEMRRILFQYLRHHEHMLLFATRSGRKMSVRNFERDFKQLCKKVGVEGVRASPHTIRHTFATNYLRNGGNLEFLRRILGHASILTTQKYVKSLGIDDLTAVHGAYSPLSRLR